MSDRNQILTESKIGYDWANKKMLVRVYEALHSVVQQSEYFQNLHSKRTWSEVIRTMFTMEGNAAGLNNIRVGGYYSTIRTILKDIGVIRYENRKLVPGPNWNRFYSDEDWSWFITNTNSGGYGKIVG